MELAILEVLWERGPSQIRDIADRVYADHNASLHATVATLLSRLARKDLVDQSRTSRTHEFSARFSRDVFLAERMKQFANTHFDGSLTSLLLLLVDRTNLPDADRDAIRKIIERQQRENL